jgi:sialic acid synthase SpsE
MAAVALGAQVIEKHFTLDRSLPGPDHAASLTPTELSSFVNQLRETSLALGDGVKRVQPSEAKNQLLVRRSLIAIREISPGETFDDSNVAALRPGTQRSPADWWRIMGSTASKRYHIGETIDENL